MGAQAGVERGGAGTSGRDSSNTTAHAHSTHTHTLLLAEQRVRTLTGCKPVSHQKARGHHTKSERQAEVEMTMVEVSQ